MAHPVQNGRDRRRGVNAPRHLLFERKPISVAYLSPTIAYESY